MGAEIDRLEVQVETQATKANNQLDKLVTKLDRVSGALSGLNNSGLTELSNGISKFTQASSQLSNVKTADFTRLTKNIQSLVNLNTQQLYSAAASMKTLSTAINSLGGVSASSLQVAQVSKDISKLGGANVQRAIANLPALAIGMKNFMATMATAPQVSNNIIQMTAALAGLAAQGSKVGTVSNALTQNVNRVGNAMSINAKKAKGFSSVIGSLYQKFFWVSRGIDKLWDSAENSMNYVETLNYFDAAFGQVANVAISQWEEAGYDSADAYYNSFSNRAKELTSKMTGFTINDDGTLSATGEASLGLNPSKLMNYQAMFAQMSSSMGVASETSLKLSQALTEIGADLASVKNMDFDKVWKDMASGLAGMSRTLDKYGVNIRNVNLQQKLFDLGINENITNLNQNDKALLRTIILLEDTTYAWGDLADTLDQPANQMRLLDSNLSNLSRTLGNLFLPALSKVLPYVNGLVIAGQRLLSWVGSLMGIDLSSITSSIGSSEVDMSELLGDTEDLVGELGNAGGEAKKLKKNLLGIDELNVISPEEQDSTSGSGAGLSSGLLDEAFEDAFSEYQKVWDEAFANMENRANEFADKFENYLKPIKDIIEDFAIGDFFKAGEDTSGLVTSIFDFFSKAIDEVEWQEIGNNIGEFLDGIEWSDVFDSAGNFIENGIEAAMELWEASFDAAPIATTIVTALGVAHFTGLDAVLKSKIIAAIPKTIAISETIALTIPISLFVKTSTKEGAEDYLGSLDKLNTFKFDEMAASDWLNALLGFGSASIGISGEFLADNTLFGNLASQMPKREDYKTLEEYNEALTEWLNLTQEASKKRFVIHGLELDEEGWSKWFIDFREKTNEFLLGDDAEFFNAPLWKWDIEGYWNESLKPSLDNVKTNLQEWWIGLDEYWSENAPLAWIPDWWNNDVVPWFEQKKWRGLGDKAKSALTGKWNEFTDWWNTEGQPEWWDNVTPWFTKEKWTELGDNAKIGLSEKWNEFTDWWETTGLYKWWTEDVEPFFDKDTWSWKGIGEGLERAFDNAFAGVKDLWNSFATWLNDKLSFSWESFSIAGQEIIPAGSITLGVLPTFNTGGFPEDGLFMANHSELVGRFSNGKTAVANNEQIVQGISSGVSSANEGIIAVLMQQNELMRQEIEYLRSINEKDYKIGDAEIARANRRGTRILGYELVT